MTGHTTCRCGADLGHLVGAAADWYKSGFAAGYRAADAELAELHRRAAQVTGAAIKLPVVTDMSGDDAALRARAVERERAGIRRFRQDHRWRRGESS